MNTSTNDGGERDYLAKRKATNKEPATATGPFVPTISKAIRRA